jgi:hypothetical protein
MIKIINNDLFFVHFKSKTIKILFHHSSFIIRRDNELYLKIVA